VCFHIFYDPIKFFSMYKVDYNKDNPEINKDNLKFMLAMNLHVHGAILFIFFFQFTTTCNTVNNN